MESIARDMRAVLDTLTDVMDRMTVQTAIGRILIPGPTYLGIWARDTGVAALGLNRLGRVDLAGELLRRYWSYQIDADSDPATFVFRNKGLANWSEADAYRPTREQLMSEVGAFPTCVYMNTPDFPAGTREIYTERADLDSVAWLIIALNDYLRHSGDSALARELHPDLERALAYLRSRDADGDWLLEQGPNQDWADILLRRGKVSYTQAVWYASLNAAAEISTFVGDAEGAVGLRREAEEVRSAVNRILLTEQGYYANWIEGAERDLHRSLDTALLVAFHVVDPERAGPVLDALTSLRGPFGPAVMEPGYLLSDIGPSKYPPGQYHNEGVWPWIAAYLALAYARYGRVQEAHDTIRDTIGRTPYTIHEWIDNVTGEPHHGDFATAAGALAWAITEAGLAAAGEALPGSRLERPHDR